MTVGAGSDGIGSPKPIVPGCGIYILEGEPAADMGSPKVRGTGEYPDMR